MVGHTQRALVIGAYPVEINDAPAMLSRHHTAADFTAMITDQFDEQARQSQNQPLVCSLSLHSPIVGQPFCIAQLRRSLQWIKDHPAFDQL